MRFSTIAATAAIAAGVSAQNATASVNYVTEVVTAYTTYCPAATEITHGTQTYTVTEATTLTITNCPCTVSKPVYTSVVTACGTCTPGTPGLPGTPVSPAVVTPAYPTGSNGTASFSKPVLPSASVPLSSAGSSSSVASTPVSTPPAFTGAANKAIAASGAGLAAVFGFAAYIL